MISVPIEKIPRFFFPRNHLPDLTGWMLLARKCENLRAYTSPPRSNTSVEPGCTHRRHHGTGAANGIARSQPHWRCVRELADKGNTRGIPPHRTYVILWGLANEFDLLWSIDLLVVFRMKLDGLKYIRRNLYNYSIKFYEKFIMSTVII